MNYNNFEETATKHKPFGNLQVKKYFGKNVEIQFIAELAKEQKKKFIGTTRYFVKENTWYFYPFNSTNRLDAFRIKEPVNGIEEILDVEFKREGNID